MHVSEHDLWTMGDNTVVVLPVSRDDLFVAALINGKPAFVWPITDHDRAVRTAQGFARRVRTGRPVTIKVLSLTGAEARAFGLIPNLSCAPTAADDAERAELVADLGHIVRTTRDGQVMAEAMDLVATMEQP